MKTRLLAVALSGLALVASPCAAAPTWLGAQVGLSMPTGDFKQEASLGFFGGLTGTYMFTDCFGIGGDVNLHSPGVDDDFEEAMAASAGSTVDAHLWAIQATPHAKLIIPMRGTVKPYVKGGLGLYNLGSRIEGGSLDVNDSQTRFGYHLGIGAQATLVEGVAATGELVYHSICTRGATSSMFTFGIGLLFGLGIR